MTKTVLHVLPHRGGGAETYIDHLAPMEGVRQVRLPFSDGRTPVEAARSLARRYAVMAPAARRADLIHAHGDVAAILAAPLFAARPAVWSSHGLHMLRRATGPAGVAVRGALRASCRLSVAICTSHAEYADVAALVAPRGIDRLALVINGVGIEAPATPGEVAVARRELELEDGELVALFLGELSERKAPLPTIDAVERARADGAPVTLLVAGDGAQRAEVEGRAGPGVRVLGQRDDARRLLTAADVLVLASEREGMSLALLEAMERGVVPVVSDGPGNPETVGDAGVVVPVGDVAALAGALAGLAADPAELARRAAATRARAETALSGARMVAETADVYRAAGLDLDL